MNELYKQVLSGLIAAISLAILALWTRYGFFFNVCVSAAIGLGVYFTIPGGKDESRTEVAPGVTRRRLEEAVAKLHRYEAELRRLIPLTRRTGIRASLKEIADTLGRIADHFRQDPGDLTISAAPMFLDFYLGRSVDLISRYVRLDKESLTGPETEPMASAEETIRRVQTGFAEFYRQCLQNDWVDLEADSEVLKTLLDSELPESEPPERTRS